MENKQIAYKGFERDLTCRGFKYEIGKEYEEKEVNVCKSGFHACENPFDVLDFYGDIPNNRFCKVEQSGIIKKDGIKQASSKIKVVAEIGFAGLFKAGIEWIKQITNPTHILEETMGKNDENKIGSIGNYAQIGSSGNSAKIGSSGNSAKIGSSGDYAQIGSSGYSAKIGSSGDYAQIGSSGYSAKIGSSGDYAKIGSSGDYAKIGSSGNSAQIGSSGDYAQIGSSGNSAKIDSTGKDSVICCAGRNSIVKAKKGSWITLSEWKYSGEKKRSIPVCVKTEFVDGKRIKEDTWYKLEDGKFEEVR
ncbi:MAG: hypothetical protein ACI39U_05460 [Candidatus Cryptobacteroides sp.]